MKKPRSDSKLMNLDELQQAKLADWLMAGIPYHEVVKLVADEFQVKTSLRALSVFWEEVCAHVLLARRQRAVTTANEIAQDAKKTPGSFDEAVIDQLSQKSFELCIQPGVDPRDVKALFSLVLKARDQSLDERRVALMERKMKQAEDTEQVLK